MKQAAYGFALFVFLALPPVARFLESVMIMHMHMQMPLLVIAGYMMARYFQLWFPGFLAKWNGNGIPGIVLFSIVVMYWNLPRAMDESLELAGSELFKFVSLTFLAGLPLRDSWQKVGYACRSTVFIGYMAISVALGLLYTIAPVQLCNNYLLIEQITLGWGFLTTAICMAVYVVYRLMIRHSEYE
ncbi:hypothetical protein [Cohnella panacarvi]|uniref:hypothetical protein n=1 Tax=Cohnella panacarvi TaxID=400776 RepID=UPI000479F3BA|nr:hypothetical protein [Cohnella panacarvi]